MFPKIRSFSSTGSLSIKSYKSGVWEPCKAPSAIAIGGHKGPLTEMKNKSDNRQWRSERGWQLPSGVLYGKGVKVCLCRSGHGFPLISFESDSRILQQDEIEGQSTGLLSSCLCDRCMSIFLYYLCVKNTALKCWAHKAKRSPRSLMDRQTVDTCSVVGRGSIIAFLWKKVKFNFFFFFFNQKTRNITTFSYQLEMQKWSSLMIWGCIWASERGDLFSKIVLTTHKQRGCNLQSH